MPKKKVTTKKKAKESNEEMGAMFMMGQQMAKVQAALESLNERLTEIEGKPVGIAKPKPVVPETKYPVPVDYKEMVNTMLNSSFGIDVIPSRDKPEFNLVIIVPKKYSNMAGGEWDMKGADMRSKIISYAQGANGVREWIEKIYKNLGPTMQALISADRANV